MSGDQPAMADDALAADDLVGALRRASVVLTEVSVSAQEDLGVTRTDLGALELLSLGRLSAGEIAEQLAVSTGTTTAIIDRLVAAGYAVRLADPSDGRRTLVSLTAKGRRRFREAFRRRWEWVQRIAAQLSPDEMRAVVGFLTRVPEMRSRQS